MLKDDHKVVEKLFKRFEQAGEKAYTEKRAVVDRIIEELSKHAAVEEQLFYPVTRATVPAVEDVALESLEEHHIVKWLLSELDGMDPQAERFVPKVTVLIENVRHHVEEEEGDYFPKVREELGRKALGELGDAMEAAKAVAPTHPHPKAPDTPPGNFVAGTAAGVVDRLGDAVSGAAQGGVAAVQDVVDRVRGTKSRRSAPKGNKGAKQAARKVRARSDAAVDDAVDAVKQAKKAGEKAVKRAKTTGRTTGTSAKAGAKRTARVASSGAKKTARTARTSAKRTTGTAKRSAAATKGR